MSSEQPDVDLLRRQVDYANGQIRTLSVALEAMQRRAEAAEQDWQREKATVAEVFTVLHAALGYPDDKNAVDLARDAAARLSTIAQRIHDWSEDRDKTQPIEFIMETLLPLAEGAPDQVKAPVMPAPVVIDGVTVRADGARLLIQGQNWSGDAELDWVRVGDDHWPIVFMRPIHGQLIVVTSDGRIWNVDQVSFPAAIRIQLVYQP